MHALKFRNQRKVFLSVLSCSFPDITFNNISFFRWLSQTHVWLCKCTKILNSLDKVSLSYKTWRRNNNYSCQRLPKKALVKSFLVRQTCSVSHLIRMLQISFHIKNLYLFLLRGFLSPCFGYLTYEWLFLATTRIDV